jgi:predicted enzyme related to lactoylglutathione lyase
MLDLKKLVKKETTIMVKPVEAVKTVFNNMGCLYLPVDDRDKIFAWYEKYFNSAGTRNQSIFWEQTEEKGLTSNFMTVEWVQGEPYEMFAVRFETDAIEELYERLSAADVQLEPMQDVSNKGLMFCYTDPQGNKFQVWQDPDTVTQPLRDGVPALIGIAALFFPVSDREVTHKWYTEFLGLEVSNSGNPITGRGEEFHFYRSLEPGRTLNFYTGAGEIQHMSIVMVNVFGIDEMHRRMVDHHGQKVQEQMLDREGCGIQFQLFDPDGNKLDIWDLQTMVERRPEGAGSSNWKERFKLFNCCFDVDVDTFLTKVIEDAPGARHRRIQILDHASLQESDPEGLAMLVETIEQFSQKYPEHVFQFIFREGPGIF